MSSSIDKTTDLTTDVYGINSYVNRIKQDFTPDVNEDTLMLGIFGYLGEMFSNTLQNTIVMASEFSNESIPTKAKFEKNIIAHALGLGLTDINAKPAQLDVLLTFIESDIINWAGAKDGDGNELPWTFTFDKDTPIYIGDFEFHTDYDIVIRKIKLENAGLENKFAFTAKYLIDIDNPISDVTNPYLTSPVRINVNGMNVIFTKCTLHQVEKTTVYKKILSDNSISAKTFTFEFEGQLAAFTIDVTEGTTTTHMVPVYDGLSVETQKYPYFYYSFLDTNTIRVKFDRTSYQPRINSDVVVNIQTTQGEGGNFTFDPETYPGYAFESDKYEYSNIGCEIRPVTGESAYGTDRKSIEDLKKLIPKEALSRGSITNIADLQNYFNMLDTDLSKLYFYKKRDNALERLYYSFMVMKDNLNVVIPTNTIDLRVRPEDLQTEQGSGKLVFKRGQVIRLVDDIGYLYDYDEDNPPDYGASFYYTIPYTFIINTDPLYGMYCLCTMDTKKFLDFSYINENCLYQYIATSISWYRGYIDNPDTYELTINLEQNIDDEITMINYDEDNNPVSANIRVVAVFYNDEGNAYRWAEAEYVSCDTDSNTFVYKFTFTTEDYIDTENKIRIDTGMYDIGTTTESYGHFDANTPCIIHIVSDQGTDTDVNGLDAIVPDLDGLVVSNSYTVLDGIDFFYDYSEIIESVIVAEKEGEVTDTDEDEDDDTTTDDDDDTTSSDDDDIDANAAAGISLLSLADDEEFTATVIEYVTSEDDEEADITEDDNSDTDVEINTDGEPEGGESSSSGDDDSDDDSSDTDTDSDTDEEELTFPDIQELVLNKFGIIMHLMSESSSTETDEDSGEETTTTNRNYNVHSIQFYNQTTLEKVGDPILLPIGDNMITFEQFPDKGFVRIYLDEDKTTYIDVDIANIADEDKDTTVRDDEGNLIEYFRIKSVPVVRADYFDTEDKVIDFCNELVSRKGYIDYAIQVLEDAFGMDFKFFNTYGPSKLFTLDNETTYLNHTNLSLTFNVKLKPNYDTNVVNDIIADIKDYIEDINEISSLHMPNLITQITTTYSDYLVFFEFVDMNGYGPGVQHLYSMDMPDEVITPEFINIQALDDGTPDITLIMM